jgi:hypothetical protein
MKAVLQKHTKRTSTFHSQWREVKNSICFKARRNRANRPVYHYEGFHATPDIVVWRVTRAMKAQLG